jgi:hypothetical protein
VLDSLRLITFSQIKIFAGRQDYTTSPSAPNVSPGDQPPALAVIASRVQRYVTIARTPLPRGGAIRRVE